MLSSRNKEVKRVGQQKILRHQNVVKQAFSHVALLLKLGRNVFVSVAMAYRKQYDLHNSISIVV